MNDDPAHLLSQSLGSLSVGVAALEAKYNRMSGMLDQTMDMHNELTDWMCNTEHVEAAKQVSAILDKYSSGGCGYGDDRQNAGAVVVPMALSRRS